MKAIIQLGHNLGLRVVAEGVEYKETYSALKDLGCDILQGYFISRPVTAKDLMGWIHRKAKDSASSNNKQDLLPAFNFSSRIEKVGF